MADESRPKARTDSSDPMREAGFQRIETIYTKANGSLHSRTDWIRIDDFPQLIALLDRLRI
jgi:hypothetical protein